MKESELSRCQQYYSNEEFCSARRFCFALSAAGEGPKWWPFSYRLLEELETDFRAGDQMLLDRLYASLEAGTGICKITSPGRFNRLDERIAEETHALVEKFSEVLIHDSAASSAVTSMELYHRVQGIERVRLCASDYFHRLWLVDIQGWTIAFDEIVCRFNIPDMGWYFRHVVAKTGDTQ